MSIIVKFIVIGCIFLLGAMTATFFVWFYLQDTLMQQPNTTDSVQTDEVTNTQTSEEAPVVAEQIPLRDLPLTPVQKNIAETVGINVDTFTLTPAMISCAEEKIGAARVADIAAGDSPSIFETAKLVTCMGAD